MRFNWNMKRPSVARGTRADLVTCTLKGFQKTLKFRRPVFYHIRLKEISAAPTQTTIRLKKTKFQSFHKRMVFCIKCARKRVFQNRFDNGSFCFGKAVKKNSVRIALAVHYQTDQKEGSRDPIKYCLWMFSSC